MVAGGKGVGKSTFLRFLVNRVLAEVGAPVLVVDLDPGQAEFTVPGLSLVSLPSRVWASEGSSCGSKGREVMGSNADVFICVCVSSCLLCF